MERHKNSEEALPISKVFAQNRTMLTLCAELDNGNFPFYSTNTTTKFLLEATPPVFPVTAATNNCEVDFTNGSISAQNDYRFPPAPGCERLPDVFSLRSLC